MRTTPPFEVGTITFEPTGVGRVIGTDPKSIGFLVIRVRFRSYNLAWPSTETTMIPEAEHAGANANCIKVSTCQIGNPLVALKATRYGPEVM